MTAVSDSVLQTSDFEESFVVFVACRLATHTKQLLANGRADILLNSIVLTDQKVREPGNEARACSKLRHTFT